jgi:hypothetical protein
MGRHELDAQAGIFSLSNLEPSAFNLINPAFIVGLPLSYGLSAFSARAQI